MSDDSDQILTLGLRVVRETRPGYSGPSRWEIRRAVEEGLPVEAVREPRFEFERLGVRRPSE